MADLDNTENMSNISTDSSFSELAASGPSSGHFVEPTERPVRSTPTPTPSITSMPSPSCPMSPASVDLATTDNALKRLEQENRVLKMEVETLKLRIKSLLEDNKSLRAASVSIQAKAEQEEEFISNTLLKRIQVLKKEKETLALNYEQEEECLTNDLSRKLNQLRAEKVQLEKTLEHEQEALVNKLMRKIEKLESETMQKQLNLEQLRREKIELENTLEQEQEGLVNRLWKRMDKLESEKRSLQSKLEEFNKSVGASPVPSPSPMSTSSQNDQSMPSPSAPNGNMSCSVPANQVDANQLSTNVSVLRQEVARLKHSLLLAEREHVEKMARFEKEEREQKEQNLRLQRKLQLEVERREALCRHLSESESSLEMDEERQFNEHIYPVDIQPTRRPRTLSSPVPPIGAFASTSPHTVATAAVGRPISPALAPITVAHCPTCSSVLPPFLTVPGMQGQPSPLGSSGVNPAPLIPAGGGGGGGPTKPRDSKQMKHS